MKHIRKILAGFVAGLAVIITLVAIDPALLGHGRLARPYAPQNDNQMASTTNSAIPPGAPIGGPFRLVDQFGQTVTRADYRGKYMLVFFGYSNCPDECPLTLQKMALAMQALGPLAQHVAPIFITIDPAHDTPAVLKNYLLKFGHGLIGLTGSKARIASVAHEYDVAFDPNEAEASGSSMINHSTYIYLMGRDGKFLNLFPFTITVRQLVAVLKAQLTRGDG